MEYPILIENEPHLMRLIQQVVKATIKESNPEKKAYSLKRSELEGFTGLSYRTNQEAINSGSLKGFKKGNSTRYKMTEIELYLNKR